MSSSSSSALSPPRRCRATARRSSGLPRAVDAPSSPPTSQPDKPSSPPFLKQMARLRGVALGEAAAGAGTLTRTRTVLTAPVPVLDLGGSTLVEPIGVRARRRAGCAVAGRAVAGRAVTGCATVGCWRGVAAAAAAAGSRAESGRLKRLFWARWASSPGDSECGGNGDSVAHNTAPSCCIAAEGGTRGSDGACSACFGSAPLPSGCLPITRSQRRCSSRCVGQEWQ